MSPPSWLAVAAVAGATALAVAPSPRAVLVGRLGGVGRLRRRWRLRGARHPWQWLLPLAVAGSVLVAAGSGAVALAATATAAAVVALRLRRRAQGRTQAQRTRARVVELCDALAAEMRAGQPAAHGLRRVADEHPEVAAAARASALGGDVPAALRSVAGAPGAHGLGAIAAAWHVAESSGAGLAVTLERIAESLRADEATAREVAAALGPPRATARLLALLPAFGLALGAGLGGNPVGFLLESTPGNVCLALGVALALGGVEWVEQLADRADTPGVVATVARRPP